jgi:carbon storage regulator
MLILTRRIGESVLIGDDIEVVVTGVDLDQVRLGFNAPRTVEIVRTELMDERRKGFKRHADLLADI